jgi:hypothetical protein
MALQYTIRPVTDFTIFTTPPAARKAIQFSATWTTTLTDLERELDYLDASKIVLEMGVGANAVKRDGMLYSNAKVGHRGVRLSFDSKHGHLSYTCDTYEGRYHGDMPDWQANVRAIAKTLEALRAVDRYGATKGEQYAGFKELPAGTGATALGGMTKDQAFGAFEAVLGFPLSEAERANPSETRAAWRRARAAAHPDRNDGKRATWDRVELAAKVLGLGKA